MGSNAVPNDPMLSKAYCEGRHARVQSALRTANPHPAGTPAYAAWDRGWLTYESGGTVVWTDCCADPPALAVRTVTAVEGADTMTVDVTVAPDIGCTIDLGDSTNEEMAPGDTVTHTYAAAGEYTITALIGSFELDSTTFTAVEVDPPL
jgi:hypothetical protein